MNPWVWKAVSRGAWLAALYCGLPAHAAGDAAAGQRVFAKRCAACHQVGPSARAAFGPQLSGLIGRRAGGTADFAYSAAMKGAGVVWDEATLRAFLQSPDSVVPGNRMRFWGMGSKTQIDDLLAYLRTVPAAGGS